MNAQQPPVEEGARRRRGAPTGNQNARKHGFYAAALTPEEQEALHEAIDLNGLQPEIALMRVKLLGLVSHDQAPPELLLQAGRTLTRMVDVQDRITHGR